MRKMDGEMPEITASELLDRAHTDLVKLRKEDEQLRRTAEGIESKRAALAAQIVKTEGAIQYFTSLLPAEPGKAIQVIQAVVGVAAAMLMAGTIGDAAARYLDAKGGSAAVNDLVPPMQEARRVSADNQAAYRLIYATLDRDKRFSRVAPGVFALNSPHIDIKPSTRVDPAASGNGTLLTGDPSTPTTTIHVGGSNQTT
jgi:hypothetical protein